jgi:dienelactone hydrolase
MLRRFIKSKFFYTLILLIGVSFLLAHTTHYPKPNQVARDFTRLLKRPSVDFNPTFQIIKTDSVLIEKGFIYSEKNERVPVLIYKPLTGENFPVVIFLHGTGGSKDSREITDPLYRLTKKGFMGVAIDARYHGERINGGAHTHKGYTDAIYNAWKSTDTTQQEHPFFYDTVYDLWRLTDYLVTRLDVQAKRIGMTGISMGGIETWMAAAVDKRIKVIVPNIAVQSFKWSLDSNQWQGRAHTIWAAHQREDKDLGDTEVNAKNVKALWDKVIPGITGEFDCPSMIRLMAPRPMLILSNEKDGNCPLPGALIAYESAKAAYQADKASDKLQMDVEANQPHRSTPAHIQMTIDWFVKWL